MDKPISYLQADPRWGKIPYNVDGKEVGSTIGNGGCGPTSAAMLIATFVDPNVTPLTVCDWALKNGYKAPNQGTYYTFFAAFGKKYGLTWTQINGPNLTTLSAVNAQQYHEKALAAVRSGTPVIACMGPGLWTTSGHYILWWGVDGDNVLINDPASTRPDKERNKLSLLQSQVKYYFICEIPDKQAEFKNAVQTLVKAGIINSPDYWLANATKLQYVPELIQNTAKYINKGV